MLHRGTFAPMLLERRGSVNRALGYRVYRPNYTNDNFRNSSFSFLQIPYIMNAAHCTVYLFKIALPLLLKILQDDLLGILL